MFAEAAGWQRLDEERLTMALEIIKADLDGLGYYGASWCVQTQGGGYSRHLCFGCSVESLKSNMFVPKSRESCPWHSARTAIA